MGSLVENALKLPLIAVVNRDVGFIPPSSFHHFIISSAKISRLFTNNADSGESARNELSHLKSALFAF